MRKNTARHLLHGLLDLLPVLIIPIFAIYVTNHEPTPISITAETQQVVDFNQQVKNGNFETNQNWSVSGSGNGFSVSNNIIHVNNYTPTFSNNGLRQDNTTFNVNDVVFFRCYLTNLSGGTRNFKLGQAYSNTSPIISLENNTTTFCEYRFDVKTGNANAYSIINIGGVASNVNYEFEVSYFNVFNLTQSFGVGNEPTIEQFNSYFPDNFYDYTISQIMPIDVVEVVYADTDLGSQFIYQLYHVTDKYFNMGNVFNLSNVYEWFNVNIFYGQSPFVMSIVYNIIVYEFIMDLLFLLYGLFMWFIDMLKRLMEKPLDSIK